MRFIACFIIVGGLALAFNADAARQKSINRIYFDASGKVIGQNAYFCNNKHWQGGDLSSAIQLSITGGCGDISVVCNGKGGCQELPPDYSIQVSLSGNPPFSKQEACQLAANACDFTEPEIVPGVDYPIGPVN